MESNRICITLLKWILLVTGAVVLLSCSSSTEEEDRQLPTAFTPQVIQVTKADVNTVKHSTGVHGQTVESNSHYQDHEGTTIPLYDASPVYDPAKEYTRTEVSKLIKPQLTELRYQVYKKAGYTAVEHYKQQVLFKERIHLASVHAVEGYPLSGKAARDAALFLEYEIRAAQQESDYVKEDLSPFRLFNTFRWSGGLAGYYLKMDEMQPIHFTGASSLLPGIIHPDFSLEITQEHWQQLYQAQKPISSLTNLDLGVQQIDTLYYVLYYDYRRQNVRMILPQPIEQGYIQKDNFGQICMYNQQGLLYRTLELDDDIKLDTNYYYNNQQLTHVVEYQIKNARVRFINIYSTEPLVTE